MTVSVFRMQCNYHSNELQYFSFTNICRKQTIFQYLGVKEWYSWSMGRFLSLIFAQELKLFLKLFTYKICVLLLGDKHHFIKIFKSPSAVGWIDILITEHWLKITSILSATRSCIRKIVRFDYNNQALSD